MVFKSTVSKRREIPLLEEEVTQRGEVSERMQTFLTAIFICLLLRRNAIKPEWRKLEVKIGEREWKTMLNKYINWTLPPCWLQHKITFHRRPLFKYCIRVYKRVEFPLNSLSHNESTEGQGSGDGRGFRKKRSLERWFVCCRYFPFIGGVGGREAGEKEREGGRKEGRKKKETE